MPHELMQQANKNFFTNILHLIANIVVGVMYTPYLVKSVGMVAYGVVPLALVINQYINVITLSLVNALTRFYSVEYRAGNIEKASCYFSTSIVVGIVFALCLYPLLHIGVGYIDCFFDIPVNLLDDAKILFRFTIASFFISIISDCVNTTLFADNLLNYVNYLKINRQFSKLLINILLFCLLDTNILYIGIANFASELLVLIMSICFYKQTKPNGVHFKIQFYNKAYLFVMLSMVVWVVLQRFSDTFLYKIDSVLMNLYFGIKMTGVIGAISELGSYIYSITAIITSLFAPILLIKYSKNNIADYKQTTIEGSYIVGLFSGLLCALICGFSTTLLRLWLGNEFAVYNLWLILKVLVIPYTTIGAMYANSYLYANFNKFPAIGSVMLAFVNVLFSIFALRVFHTVTIFLTICTIFIILQGLVMNICFYQYLYKDNLKKIVVDIAKCSMYIIMMFIISYAINNITYIYSLQQFVALGFIVFLSGLVILDAFFLNQREHEIIKEVIPVYEVLRHKLICIFKQK